MNLKRVAAVPTIIAGAKEHRLPEVADDWKVMVEIEPRDVCEYKAYQIVDQRLVVEIDH